MIEGYSARLNAKALGFGLRAMVRVNLKSHSEIYDSQFETFLNMHRQVRAAFSVSGDADYILDIHVRDLDEFSTFIHKKLLVHPQVSQVRSDVVLKTMKEEPLLDL